MWRRSSCTPSSTTADVPVYAAQARATELAGPPPPYVSVMHCNPLRDEGVACALALLAEPGIGAVRRRPLDPPARRLPPGIRRSGAAAQSLGMGAC